MAEKRYSEDEIDFALSALQWYQGDFTKAARFVQVPVDLLKRWKHQADRTGHQPKDPMAPIARPMPPEVLLDELDYRPRFVPAPEVWEWMQRTFIADGAILQNQEHEHLQDATIGVLWTNVANAKQGNRIVGTCEIPNVQGGRWTKARMEFQLYQWFQTDLDFLIILDAVYAAEVDDATFCALCEHELYHAGQKKDLYGAPLFSKESGLPLFTMRGHDVEEFTGVVRRYGAAAAGEHVQAFVEAAQQSPLVAAADIASACGTCVR